MLGGNAWRVLKLGEGKTAGDGGWTQVPGPETANRQPADLAAVAHRKSD
jgi:hypothetical protein